MAKPNNGHWPDEELGPPPAISEATPQSLSSIALGKHEPPDWFFGEFLPQGAFMIVGRPKIGKSWLLLQLAVTAALAGKFLGFEALGTFPVAYFAAEDEPGRIASRLAHFKLDSFPPSVHLFLREDCEKLAERFAPHYTFPQFLELWLEANQGIKIILLDTEESLRSMWRTYGVAEKVEREVTRQHYRETRDFDRLAHKQRAFVGLVNHTAKGDGNRKWKDIHELVNRPNTALGGCSGSMVIADPPGVDPMSEEHHCKVLGMRGRDMAKDQLIAVDQDAFGMFQSLGPFQAHRQTETQELLLEALAEMIAAKECNGDGWVSSKALSAWAQRGEAGTKRALTRVIAAGHTTWKGKILESRQKLGFRLINPADL